jgi:hypothetical protein
MVAAVAVAVAVTMAVQPVRRATEAAIGWAAVKPAIRTRDRRATRPAILPRRQAHRYRADRGASHQCQHHTTRAFHGCDPVLRLFGETSVSITCGSGSKRKPIPFTASCWDQPPEKPKACAKEPKPPRCTPCEPESDVPEDEWLEEESLE